MANPFYFCSKIWITYFSIMIFFSGIALIIVDLILFNFDEILPTRDFIKGGTAVIWVLFTLGLLCIIYGAAGFIGALKDNKYLIIFYTCGMGFFILVLATLSILFFILYFKLDDNFSCTDLGILKDVDEMNKLGQQLLCSSQCPCNAQRDWLVSYLETNHLTASLAGKVKAQDCSTFNQDVGDDYESLYKSMKWIEEKFNCSGICSKPDYFIFSDINADPPEKFCIEEIRDKARSVSLIMGFVCGSCTLLFCFTLMKSCCMCWIKPERTNYGQVGPVKALDMQDSGSFQEQKDFQEYQRFKKDRSRLQMSQRETTKDRDQNLSTQLRPNAIAVDVQQKEMKKIRDWNDDL